MTPKTRIATLVVVLAALATPLLAHAGHAHTYMGVVTTLNAPHSFTIKTIDGKAFTVATSNTTAWTDAAGRSVKESALATGDRVVVKMTTDGHTAAHVTMSVRGR